MGSWDLNHEAVVVPQLLRRPWYIPAEHPALAEPGGQETQEGQQPVSSLPETCVLVRATQSLESWVGRLGQGPWWVSLQTPNLCLVAGARRLKQLLSFALGGLLGNVFLHLLPEAWAYTCSASRGE